LDDDQDNDDNQDDDDQCDNDDKDNIDDIDDDDIDLSSVIFHIIKRRKIINFVCYHKQLKGIHWRAIKE